jgi:hypothetical protein
MRYTAYYIIRSRPELVAKLADTQYADLETLVGPLLWTHEQGGRSTFTKQDHIIAVKRLYVEYIRNVVPGPEAVGVGELLACEEPFDKWWTLEVFDGYHNTVADAAREVEEIVGPDALAALSPIFTRAS